MATTLQKRAGALTGLAAALLIALATLTSAATAELARTPFCILCGEHGTVDFVLNVVLFLPLGVGLRLAGLRRVHVVAVALSTTLLVELLQLKVVVGRDASLGDLLANGMGGTIGLLLVDHWRWWLQPDRPRARWLALGAAALFLVVLATTAWGLQRSLPKGRYWGQWRFAQHDTERFRGTVLGVDLNGRPLAANLIPADDPHIGSLRGDSVTLSASVLPGAPTRRVASIASVGADPTYKLLALAQRRNDLVFRLRLRASELLLRSPTLGIAGALAAASDGERDTIRLSGRYVPGLIALTASARQRNSQAAVPLTVGLGWSFLLPVEISLGHWALAAGALWLALLCLPLAYWAKKAWRRPFHLLVPAAVAAIGLGLLPLTGPVASTSLVEWMGAALGLTLGILAAGQVPG